MKKLIVMIPVLLILLGSCGREDVPAVPSDAISIVPFSSSPSLTADGDTTLKVQVKKEGTSNIQKVTVTTNLGKFINGETSMDITFDNHGLANAYLKSTVVGNATITATATTTVGDQVAVSGLIHFTTSHPDRINVNCNAAMTNALGEKLVLTSLLSKDKGVVSEGLDLIYKAFDASGNLKGTFLNRLLSNAEHTATVDYWLQDSTYTGLIVFKALSTTDTSVYGVNQVYVGAH